MSRNGTHTVARLLAAIGFMIALAVLPAWAQGEAAIRGKAVASATDAPLTGLALTLTSIPSGESMQTTTDSEGRFVFQGLRPGEYLLSSGHESLTARDLRVTLEPREIRIVALLLDLRRVDVAIHVSVDATAITSAHSPSSTLLSAERLATMPVSQRTTLTDAIVTLAPGMIRGHDDFVHIRGHEIALNPSINGVSFWENPHAVFSAGVSPAVIETANVMTGGFAAEYGNRFGGVVDIVTKSGLVTGNSAAFTLSAGQAGRRNLLGEIGRRRGQFGVYLFGSWLESKRFLSPPDPTAIHDGARGGHAFTQVDANFGRAGSLRLIVMGDGMNFEIPTRPLDVTLRPLANANQRTRQQTAIVGWTRAVSDTAVSASFYQRWSRSRLLPAVGPLTAFAWLNRELATIGGKVDVTRFAGRHVIKAGVDAVWLRPQEDLTYDDTGYLDLTHVLGLPHIHVASNAVSFTGRASGRQFSAYVQDAIQLGARLTADVGVRVDRYDLLVSATHASPRVNLAFEAGRGAVLHASYNHFFVPPAIEGVLSSSAGLTARILEIGRGLPPLEPTTENQFEWGASAPIGPLRLGLTGYYRSTDNPVHTTVWPDSRIYSYASFDREHAYGLETKADLPGLVRYGVTAYLNYALGRVTFDNPVTGGFVTEAGHLTETNRFLAPMDQTHTLTTGATYRHGGTGLWIGTAVEYGSGTPMGHGGAGHTHAPGEADHQDVQATSSALRVPGHATANLSFGINLRRDRQQRSRASFQFDIENITNNAYRIAQDGEFSPAQFAGPRLMSATATVRF